MGFLILYKERKEGRKEGRREEGMEGRKEGNKAGYTATEVACGWAGAIFEVTGAFGQEQ